VQSKMDNPEKLAT